jgi:hypothetical protein
MASGQFTQQDPIGIAGGLNLYGYAGGDPINFSDPFGLCPWCPAVIGGVVGVVTEGLSQAASRSFNGNALVTAGATGALSGQFAALKVGKSAMLMGQAAIGGLGGLLGGGDQRSFGSGGDIAQGAVFGFLGEAGGQLLEGVAGEALESFPGYLDEFVAHHAAQGVPRAELDRFRGVVMEVFENRRSELAGFVAGLVQGAVNR